MDTPTLFKGKAEQKRQVHVLFILLLYPASCHEQTTFPCPKLKQRSFCLNKHFQGCFKILIKDKFPQNAGSYLGLISFQTELRRCRGTLWILKAFLVTETILLSYSWWLDNSPVLVPLKVLLETQILLKNLHIQQ